MSYKHTLLKSLGTLAAASAFCVVMVPGQADARSNYGPNIPNGGPLGQEIGGNGRDCALCHVSANGGGSRNAFGQDVQNNLSNGPDWSGIYSLDSDGDGASNGEELCDPMGTWMTGDANPDCEFTDPSDPNDKPAPADMDMGMGMDMAPEADMGVDMAPEADMGTTPVDMGTTPVDMGTTPVDMGTTPVADMGTSSPADMGGTPAADMGAAGADMGGTTGGGGGDEEDDEGCSQTGAGSPVGGGLTLLGMLGMLGIMRKRRR